MRATVRLLFGRKVLGAARNFEKKWSLWLRNEGDLPVPAFLDLFLAVMFRGALLGFILALAPSIMIGLQVLLLFNQNRAIEKQNQLAEANRVSWLSTEITDVLSSLEPSSAETINRLTALSWALKPTPSLKEDGDLRSRKLSHGRGYLLVALSKMNMEQAAIDAGAVFQKADLRGVDLRRTNLRHVPLRVASLRNGRLQQSDFFAADLRGTDCFQSNFRRSDLTDASLERANLERANLRRCKLVNTNLRGADLSNANLDGADSRGAHLEDSIGLTIEQVLTAKRWDTTDPQAPTVFPPAISRELQSRGLLAMRAREYRIQELEHLFVTKLIGHRGETLLVTRPTQTREEAVDLASRLRNLTNNPDAYLPFVETDGWSFEVVDEVGHVVAAGQVYEFVEERDAAMDAVKIHGPSADIDSRPCPHCSEQD